MVVVEIVTYMVHWLASMGWPSSSSIGRNHMMRAEMMTMTEPRASAITCRNTPGGRGHTHIHTHTPCSSCMYLDMPL